MKFHSLSQADLSRMIGVSRQAVSLWFKSKNRQLRLYGHHQVLLAQTLGMSVEKLVRPLPLIKDQKRMLVIQTELLWDHAYPCLFTFFRSLLKEDPFAMARLVQAYGLFEAANILGKNIWTKFHVYKKFIKPQQRQQWEKIWILQKKLNLI